MAISHRPFYKISRVRVSPLILLLHLLLLSPSSSSSAAAAAAISYSTHCATTVPQSITTFSATSSASSFQIINGHFSGGDELLGSVADPTFSLPRSFSFHPQSLTHTTTPSVLHLSGTLTLRGGGFRIPRRNLTSRRSLFARVRPRFPRTYRPRGKASFDLSGFYSASSGLLCMVGPGHGRSNQGNSLDVSAVFKLRYPNTSTIVSALASGTIDVLLPSADHFNQISVLAYAQQNYHYTQISNAGESCSRVSVNDTMINFGNLSSCVYIEKFLKQRFRLDYRGSCSGRRCRSLHSGSEFVPSFMSLNQIECSKDRKIRMYIGFSNLSSLTYESLLVPGRALVGEGVWDSTRNRLCFIACRIPVSNDPLLDTANSDCTIGFSLWFPAVYTIESRSAVVGRIWSNREESDSAYFDAITFRSFGNIRETVPGLRYEYTKMDLVRKSCVLEIAGKAGKKKYPDGKSFADMRFVMFVRDREGINTWGRASPLSIGDRIYRSSYTVASTAQEPEHGLVETNHNLWNISYKISYTLPNASIVGPGEISAEGIYNAQTGLLCLVGCQNRDSVDTLQVKHGDATDCAILINIQLTSLNPKDGEHHTGMIRSTREKSDPFFFEPLEISSYGLYTAQAAESISRMDIEIAMVLISLTLSCVFIGLQLFHIKKYPHVLPSISITMLVVLTLCHMIPLVLNFEALFFMNRNRKNVLLRSGGWLEVNEVVVRIITMVAFLLQFRLLQVAWSARTADESQKEFWIAERKTILSAVPIYLVACLIAWLVHLRSNEPQLIVWSHMRATQRHSLWDDITSYAGLILDGFLLPQVILNIFLNSKDRALAPCFYVGTTIVRALPHIYDAYRAHHYMPHFKSSYIYARPDRDLYSFAWDIIIPCEGVIFAVLIFLQQRFGGTCILPLKNKQPAEYEMVPVVTH